MAARWSPRVWRVLSTPAARSAWTARCARSDTLEWSVASPPPAYNFLHIPVVSGPNAIWNAAPDQPYVTGLSFEKRQILVTKVLDAEPDHREELPDISIWPFLLAVASTFGLIGSIFYAWFFPIGLVLAGIVGIGWFWPKPQDIEHQLKTDAAEARA